MKPPNHGLRVRLEAEEGRTYDGYLVLETNTLGSISLDRPVLRLRQPCERVFAPNGDILFVLVSDRIEVLY